MGFYSSSVAWAANEEVREKEPAVQEEPSEPESKVEEKDDEEPVAVARPVSADPVQIYGWKERILIDGVESSLRAKLDTGALTSSIHAEDVKLFERDGKKWVRFIITVPRKQKSERTQVEARLVRVARIKQPGGESVAREVVRLDFRIGDRKMRGDFSLNNRSNMLAPVLLGRSVVRELGLVDAGRTYIADDKVLR